MANRLFKFARMSCSFERRAIVKLLELICFPKTPTEHTFK